jgi:hypothetical protein
MRNYDEETQKSVDSFLYLKGIMEDLAKKAQERKEQLEREGK